MVAGERLVANDGKEVMLFPLPYMYISQGEFETFSHAGIYAIDFMGWDANGRVYQAPMYAPCSCKCVATIDAYNKGRIFQSIDPVHTPNGLQYVTFMWFHDNNPIASVGDTFTQGDLIGHTGTAGGVTGDHTHFNSANGKYSGWEQVPPNNNWQLVNEMHIYDACYVNDTTIINGYNYNWREWNGPTPPTKKKEEKRFPWVLYSRKLRRKKR